MSSTQLAIIGWGRAKYRDLSVASRSIICQSRRLRQIIDLRDQFWEKKVCYMCRFVVLPNKCIAFFKSLLLLPLLLQQLPILKGHMVTTYGQMQNVFVYKCNYWLLWKCSCFVKRYFLHIQYKCNETLSIEWNIYKYFVIWKLIEANIVSAWIIIASWTYCWKYFVIGICI